MAGLSVEFVSSLQRLSNQEIDAITGSAGFFASARWFRFLDALDHSQFAGGNVELGYLLAAIDGKAVAVCPMIRASGAGLYFLYSLRKFFFEHWIDEAARLRHGNGFDLSRVAPFVSGFRKALEAMGTKLDVCLLAVSPLSYRTQIAISPSAAGYQSEIAAAMVEEMQRRARQRNIPLWIQCVGEEAGWPASALEARGFQKAFLFHDNRIELENCDDLGDYLRSFRRTTRRAFERDIRRTRDAGISFSFLGDFSDCAEQFADLYSRTYSKYGSSHFHHPPQFWRQLCRSLDSSAEAVVARRDKEVIGFSILLHDQRRREMWTYRIGRSDVGDLDRTPYYFELSFYKPIERAIELGCRRIWLGPASYQAKSVRGAEQIPLYSYFWFPRPLDRWTLGTYLRLFGRISREQIEQSIVTPVRVRQIVSEESSESVAEGAAVR